LCTFINSFVAERNLEKQHLGIDSCRSVCHTTEEQDSFIELVGD
jgi:hypothetical protein